MLKSRSCAIAVLSETAKPVMQSFSFPMSTWASPSAAKSRNRTAPLDTNRRSTPSLEPVIEPESFGEKFMWGLVAVWSAPLHLVFWPEALWAEALLLIPAALIMLVLLTLLAPVFLIAKLCVRGRL